MEFTLTYQGPLPSKQRGISPVKALLRQAFHPQIKAHLDQRLTPAIRPRLVSNVDGHEFIAPATPELGTAVELDVLLLSPPRQKIGDADNRLKTLIDGLTRPANKEQMQNHVAPLDGGPTYCLLQDDRLVQRIGLDTRRWYGAPSDPSESLVVVTAKVVLSADVTVNGPTSATFLVL
ncbi:MAG: hypothetical protein CMH35_00190 [Microbacterium sp.]|uniref:hypothetical protein n=1 Tax=Microbacterium sp. UBA3394 TaxID=1946945 RepID=UPI000C48C41F|nr:hypothetical protein [Microbacterium sp. UBA3394]MAM53272.1 hypothetical protein [Microbacterium sp.]|tara:strand:- start:2544 stop:3074 length:531 start_codon:yes stop_codon:yes gene_type:complete